VDPVRIAVLGAGGFLGSHLVPALLARRDCVIDAVDLTFAKLGATPKGRVRRIEASIARPGLLEEIVADNDLVVSLTALCNPSLLQPRSAGGHRRQLHRPGAAGEAVRGTRALAGALLHLRGLRLRALDAEGRPTPLMSEDETALMLGPVHKERWSYACAKQLLERVIFAHGEHGGLPFTIIRPFNVIGPRMDFLPGLDGEGLPRVLASFMGALLRGEPLPLVDGGAQRRSFISVQDFVEGVLRVLERPARLPGRDHQPRQPRQRRQRARPGPRPARRLRPPAARGAAVRAARRRRRGAVRPGYEDSRERIPDLGKAERLLGWRPPPPWRRCSPAIVEDYVARYAPLLEAARRARAVR
jgi:UDP-apiose/xylose synthase